jgi:hypothetical protein
MLIIARFSGLGSGKDLLIRAISPISSGFPIPSRLRREAVAQWGQTADPDEATTQPLRRLPCEQHTSASGPISGG